MSNKNWHENTPKNGVLCKESGTGFIFAVTKEMIDKAPTINDIDRLTPLTPAEWWDFAPWSRMDSAPIFTPIFLICQGIMQNVLYGINENDDLYVYDTDETIDAKRFDCEKWLPLPTNKGGL